MAGRLLRIGRGECGGQGLEGGRGQVEQQFAQMGAAGHAAHVLLDGLAPAARHGAAHHLLQCGTGQRAVVQRRGVHRGFDGVHDQIAAHGHAQPHVVDGCACGANAAIAQGFSVERLAVVQFGFDVPQTIFAFIALVDDPARMAGFAGGRGTQGHENSSLGSGGLRAADPGTVARRSSVPCQPWRTATVLRLVKP